MLDLKENIPGFGSALVYDRQHAEAFMEEMVERPQPHRRLRPILVVRQIEDCLPLHLLRGDVTGYRDASGWAPIDANGVPYPTIYKTWRGLHRAFLRVDQDMLAVGREEVTLAFWAPPEMDVAPLRRYLLARSPWPGSPSQ